MTFRTVSSAFACVLLVLGAWFAFSRPAPSATPSDALGQPWFVQGGTQVFVDVPGQVPDPAAAFKAIADWRIGAGSFVTIRVQPGIYAMSTPLTIDHPDGLRVGLAAARPVVSPEFSGVVSVAGRQDGGADVILRVTGALDLAVGQWLRVTGTSGTGSHAAFRGLYRITALTEDTITLDFPHPAPGLARASLAEATLFVPAVQLDFAVQGQSAEEFSVDIRTSLGDLSNVAIVAQERQNYSNGVRIGDGATLIAGTGGGKGGLSIAGFGRHCLWAFRNGQATVDGVTVSDCGGSGIQASQGAQVEAARGLATGNNIGFAAVDGGQVTCSLCTAVGNGDGYFAVAGGRVIASRSVATAGKPGGVGYRARPGGFVWAEDGEASGNENGLVADGGTIWAARAASTTNRRLQFEPAPNAPDRGAGSIRVGPVKPPEISDCGAGASIRGNDLAGTVTLGADAGLCVIAFQFPPPRGRTCAVADRSGRPVVHRALATGIAIVQAAARPNVPLAYTCVDPDP